MHPPLFICSNSTFLALYRQMGGGTNPDTIIDAFCWLFLIVAHTALSLPHGLQMDTIYSQCVVKNYFFP